MKTTGGATPSKSSKILRQRELHGSGRKRFEVRFSDNATEQSGRGHGADAPLERERLSYLINEDNTQERSRELSGGQWQRVGLARGLMRPAPLLTVLDEPTAALDAPTEAAIFERFAGAAERSAAAGAVTVLVSHRFSTVRIADRIVVLEDGRITETGGHDELMAAGGTYAQLFALQAKAYRPNSPS